MTKNPNPWCQTHAVTVNRDDLVPATKVDFWGRSQCDRCHHVGMVLRGRFT